LKEARFYKRTLTEDIEPALRLDLAPGVSWLTRRAVLSGICEGGLVVEPMPSLARKYAFPCALCGERRTGAENERTHRFRTSENEMAQRYPLCTLCLEKVRACCELAGYLRLILDGHIRIGDAEEEQDTWDETIRLRERIFWARIGGGVVPTWIPGGLSDKASPVTDIEPPPSKDGLFVPDPTKGSTGPDEWKDHPNQTETEAVGDSPPGSKDTEGVIRPKSILEGARGEPSTSNGRPPPLPPRAPGFLPRKSLLSKLNVTIP
jgi:hypothetical protein